MAAPKSLILSMTVDRAAKGHKCHHSKKHVIAKGDLRLKVKVGRGHEHYCVECAQKFIGNGVENLQKLSAELEAQAAGEE
jgi:hypothetical protein